MIELKPGMKAYAKNLSIHLDGNEFIFNAPRGKKFAVILMTDEKPDNTSGVYCNEWLNNMGWELKNE